MINVRTKNILELIIGIICFLMIFVALQSKISSGYLILLGAYNTVSIKKLTKNEKKLVQEVMNNNSQSMLWLITRKGNFSAGHTVVILQEVSTEGEISHNTFSHAPGFGFLSYKSNNYLNLISETEDENLRYTAMPISQYQIQLLYKNYEKSSKKFCLNFVSEVVPIPWNGDLILGHCSSFAAKLYNDTLGTKFVGSDPLLLSI
jgi:hypothetical protein